MAPRGCKAPPARRTLRKALVLKLRQQAQASRGVRIAALSSSISRAAAELPTHERAGAPLVRTPVRPEKWRTTEGKEVAVDLARVPWLPDDWGQGVKTTNAIARSKAGQGGTYTVYVSPKGRIFYHKGAVEAFLGRELGPLDGFNGQLKLARLQGKCTDERRLFALLTRGERLPGTRELHFCVISARRAATGIADLAAVQAQFEHAGVEPTWYVDRPSLRAYRRLGFKAVVGGALAEARNRALCDAERLGKACVQVSDDVSHWEYREGPPATESGDTAANAAHAAAVCHVISPVAAARFVLAKMRPAGARLGGVYPLGSCARGFGSEAVSRRHFILGDFFVAERSPVRFDTRMTLKEDYDFTCAHIAAHGSVLRCNRLTVNAKHRGNAGGACSMRDAAGEAERRNIAILFSKWPQAFRMHPKRKDEVVLCWPGARKPSPVLKHVLKSGLEPRPKLNVRGLSKRKAEMVIRKAMLAKAEAVLRLGPSASRNEYIKRRCKAAAGKTVSVALSKLRVRDGKGQPRNYRATDLRYDLQRGFLLQAEP